MRYWVMPLTTDSNEEASTYVCETERCEGKNRRADFLAVITEDTPDMPIKFEVLRSWRECGACNLEKLLMM